jgi:dipeptidyl aminopeptidase/acylaminoacyl peptidase
MRFATAVLAAACPLLACTKPAPNEPPAPPVTEYSVADFYGNTSIFGADFSPDHTKILIGSNASGVYNVYTVPVAGGDPVPVTQSTTNSIDPVSYFPADERILYSSDEGGNELTHLYVKNPDGTTKDLTPGAKVQAHFQDWSGDGQSFWVTTNERDPRYFDLYRYATNGLTRTLLFRNDAGFAIGPISRDGRYVALGKSLGASDADIYLYDVQTKTTKNLTAHQGAVSNRAATWTPDGSKLLILTDQGREFSALRSLDPGTGAIAGVIEPNWDVVGAEYTKSGKFLNVVINQDARYVVQSYRAETFEPVPIAVPPAGLTVIGTVQVSPNDSMVAFYASDGASPSDLYVAPVGGAARRLTNTLNPKIKAADLVRPEVARFKSYDSLEVPGVLYRPHQASATAKLPALVMVHGGPGGEAMALYNPIALALANHGYVVFDINNRGSSGYGKTFNAMDNKKHGEADLGDVVASKRMLAGLGYVDTTKIGIVGGSYGGYMTLAALTLAPGQFKVGVDLFGPANWIRTLSSIPPWWASFRQSLYDEMGDPKTDSVRLYRISPLFHADRINVPLMVLQGANDPRVMQKESDEIVAAAKKNGVPVEYIVFPDEGHGFVKRANEIKGYTAVIAFLDQHLKGAGR